MSDALIAQAVTILQAGGLVAVPTETVYGLAGDARSLGAVKKIFRVKQRPADHPLIVHIAHPEQLTEWARDIPEMAWQLVNTFWPGPLTVVLKKAADVSPLITGGQETIALRIPRHPIALALLEAFGGALAAPSANRFGHISPTTADDVREELAAAVDLILDGGPCEVGVESTIVDFSTGTPSILRPGAVTAAQIESVLGIHLASRKNTAPRVSGSHAVHYAPTTKTTLVTPDQLEAFLLELTVTDVPVALLVRRKKFLYWPGIHWETMPTDAKAYAQALYHRLRELDKMEFKQIIIESVPDDPEWDAVRDRLQRACGKNSLSHTVGEGQG